MGRKFKTSGAPSPPSSSYTPCSLACCISSNTRARTVSDVSLSLTGTSTRFVRRAISIWLSRVSWKSRSITSV